MNETIYVHPGLNSCAVYALPYPMKPGQAPRDIGYRYRSDWRQIARLNHELKLVWIEAEYKAFEDDIVGAGPGVWFEIDRDAGTIV